jgi:hypothetical protein
LESACFANVASATFTGNTTDALCLCCGSLSGLVFIRELLRVRLVLKMVLMLYRFPMRLNFSETAVGATHFESSASQSARTTAAPSPIGLRAIAATYLRHAGRRSRTGKHPLVSNGSVNTLPRRYDSWINNPLLGDETHFPWILCSQCALCVVRAERI